MVLRFKHTEVTDEGTYRCEAFNSQGTVFREAPLMFKCKYIFRTLHKILTCLIYYFSQACICGSLLLHYWSHWIAVTGRTYLHLYKDKKRTGKSTMLDYNISYSAGTTFTT